MKYFLGLEIPQAQREALTEIMDSARWGFEFVRPGRLHITTRFLGKRPSHIELTRRKLREVQFTGRTVIQAHGVGWWGRPPVLWAGLWNDGQFVRNIHDQIDEMLGNGTSYSPHITLAKGENLTQEHYEQVSSFLAEHRNFRTDPWLMDRLTLFASPGGGEDYQVVETYPILW